MFSLYLTMYALNDIIHYKNYIPLVLEMSRYMRIYRTGTWFVPEFYTGTYQYMGAGLAQAV
jgi:hypothetical protein